jgi:hypothetical protein
VRQIVSSMSSDSPVRSYFGSRSMQVRSTGSRGLGEIQDYERSWPPRRKRRGLLSCPGRILFLPFIALIGLGLFLATAPGIIIPFGVASAFTGDRGCRDFATRWEAQWFFWQAGPGDPNHLDDDRDGLACEFNPWLDLAQFGR